MASQQPEKQLPPSALHPQGPGPFLSLSSLSLSSLSSLSLLSLLSLCISTHIRPQAPISPMMLEHKCCFIHMYMYVHAQVYVYSYTCFIHMYVHTHVYMYVHTHVSYTCICMFLCLSVCPSGPGLCPSTGGSGRWDSNACMSCLSVCLSVNLPIYLSV